MLFLTTFCTIALSIPCQLTELQLAELFASFFSDKIASVRSTFNNLDGPTYIATKEIVSKLDHFQLVETNDIVKTISSTPSKSCALDPIPTWLIKKCSAIPPLLRDVVNHSLSSASMPTSLKQAHVIPILKKSSLDHGELKNYRPVSNLAYSSKLIERVVSLQLQKHCQFNNLNLHFQSAYKSAHSTETALIRVQNDLLKAVDSLGGAILVLLDLSAAFDTIDHAVLFKILETNIGISGSALAWFVSYLNNRNQSVRIGHAVSSPRLLPFGVPQGSVLGPQLFSLYTQPLHHILDNSGVAYHMYADDIQIYLTFNPKGSFSPETIELCLANISEWMQSHFLKLNSDKSELLVITKPSLSQCGVTSLNICGTIMNASQSVRNLGVYYDSVLKMDTHIMTICKKAYYQIHLIHKVRKYISEDAAKMLVQASVTPLLDYCNGFLIGLPVTLLNQLLCVQNCAAHTIKCAPKFCHIMPLLKDIRWLPVKYDIQYKTV